MRSFRLVLAVLGVLAVTALTGGAAADVAAPVIDSSTPASPGKSTNPTLNGTAAPSSVVTLYTDSACTTPVAGGVGTADASTGAFAISVTVSADSSTTFYATATDSTPSSSPCSAGFTYVEDSSAPAAPTIVSSIPTSPANNNTPTLNGTADAGTTVNVYTDASCSMTAAGTGPADASGNFSIPVSVSDNTTIVFHATATDAAANSSPCSAGFTYVEDSTPPATPSIDSSTPSSPANDNSPTLNGTAETGSSVSVYTNSTCTSAVAGSDTTDGSGSFHVKVEVQDNSSTTFYARATDTAGNSSPCSIGFLYVEDSVSPVVTLTDKPPLITNQTTATFSFTSDKKKPNYQCKLDGGSFAPCDSPKAYSGLSDGSHMFSVQAKAVNEGAPTTYTWTVDTVAPNTVVTSGPPASSQSATASFRFSSSEAGSTFTCSLDAGGFAPCSSPHTYAGLGDGSHTFRVEAVDPAGNADTTAASYSWQISGVGPETIDHTPPANVRRLRKAVGYRLLRLRWRKPPDADFDHVSVFVSTSRKSPPRTLVYTGKSTRYTKKRFKNGLYYRYLVVSYDHAANGSRGAGAVVLPSILLHAPRNGRTVRVPPLLGWGAVRRATFYNVQLYYGSQKVLSAWPNKAKLRLRRNWLYSGRRFHLKSGVYRWYVWPGFGPRSRARYGQLLGQATFRVR